MIKIKKNKGSTTISYTSSNGLKASISMSVDKGKITNIEANAQNMSYFDDILLVEAAAIISVLTSEMKEFKENFLGKDLMEMLDFINSEYAKEI